MSRLLVCALASVAIHAFIIAAYSLPGIRSVTTGAPAISFEHTAMRLSLAEAPMPSSPLKAPTSATASMEHGQPVPPVENRENRMPEKGSTLGFSNPRHYYRSSDLDTRPEALNAIEPDYVARREDAYIVLRLLINERGYIDQVTSVIGDAGEAEQSAITAFKAARFSPGMLRGVPVSSEMWVELKFYASSEGPDASQRADDSD